MEEEFIDEKEFAERLEWYLGSYYSEKSTKIFIKECLNLLHTSPQFAKIVRDKAFWEAFHKLTVSPEGPTVQTDKPDIAIHMDSDTACISTSYADKKGPLLVTYGELHYNHRNECLECRKVTERAVSDELHEIKSEEHIYFEGLEFINYEGRCSRNAQTDFDNGHGNMIPHFFIMDYGHLKNSYYDFDETIVRYKGIDSVGAYIEVRRWKEDYRDMEEYLLYRQDTQTPSIKSAPGCDPQNITAESRTHTDEAKESLKKMRISISDEQLSSDNNNSMYSPFANGRQR